MLATWEWERLKFAGMKNYYSNIIQPYAARHIKFKLELLKFIQETRALCYSPHYICTLWRQLFK